MGLMTCTVALMKGVIMVGQRKGMKGEVKGFRVDERGRERGRALRLMLMLMFLLLVLG